MIKLVWAALGESIGGEFGALIGAVAFPPNGDLEIGYSICLIPDSESVEMLIGLRESGELPGIVSRHFTGLRIGVPLIEQGGFFLKVQPGIVEVPVLVNGEPLVTLHLLVLNPGQTEF